MGVEDSLRAWMMRKTDGVSTWLEDPSTFQGTSHAGDCGMIQCPRVAHTEENRRQD